MKTTHFDALLASIWDDSEDEDMGRPFLREGDMSKEPLEGEVDGPANVLSDMGMTLNRFRTLAGLQPIKPLGRSANGVVKFFTLFGKRVTEDEVLEWQAQQLTKEAKRRITLDVSDVKPKEMTGVMEAVRELSSSLSSRGETAPRFLDPE